MRHGPPPRDAPPAPGTDFWGRNQPKPPRRHLPRPWCCDHMDPRVGMGRTWAPGFLFLLPLEGPWGTPKWLCAPGAASSGERGAVAACHAASRLERGGRWGDLHAPARQPVSGVGEVGVGGSRLPGQDTAPGSSGPGCPDAIPCLQNISSASPRASRGSVTSPPHPGPAGPLGSRLAMKLGTTGTAMGHAPALHEWSWRADVRPDRALGSRVPGEPQQRRGQHGATGTAAARPGSRSGREVAAVACHGAVSAAAAGGHRAGARRLRPAHTSTAGVQGPAKMPGLVWGSSPRSCRLGQHQSIP